MPIASDTAHYLEAIAHLPVGGTLILTDVPWEEYEQLLADLGESNRVRVNYDQGRLEMMSPSARHEKYKELILRLADTIADELDCDLDSFGSATFRQAQFDQGAEPDTCFYVQNAARVTGKDCIDLSTDPPPDVVVEIDLSHGSAGKLAFYASLGVPELWRYDDRRLRIYHLTEHQYVEALTSRAFPLLTSEVLSQFLERSKTERQRTVLKAFRQWLRAHQSPAP